MIEKYNLDNLHKYSDIIKRYMIFHIIIIFFLILFFLFFLFYIYLSQSDGKFRAQSVSDDTKNTIPEFEFKPPATKVKDDVTNIRLYMGDQIVNDKFKYRLEKNSTITYNKLGKKGNTGNQLFEIASTLGIAYKNKCKVIFPRIVESDILNLFDLKLPFTHFDINVDEIIPEYDNYEDIIIPDDNKIYELSGYRQTWKYFDTIKDHIIDTIVVKPKLIEEFKSIVKDKYWISLHVRRTDSVTNGPLSGFSIPQVQYYKSAIEYIRKSTVEDMKIIVSTDDPEWVKMHLNFTNMILNPFSGKESSKEMDFINLYLSDYSVIGVSTFSWWASYLNPKKKIVCCPSPWWNPDKIITRMFSLQHSPITDKSWTHLHPDTGIIHDTYPYNSNYSKTKSSILRSMRAFITS
jgi:hypothetical protein